MFGSIGVQEIILIFIIALLLFGPKKIPEISKTIGKAIREFKKATNEVKKSLEDEVEKIDEEKPYSDDEKPAGWRAKKNGSIRPFAGVEEMPAQGFFYCF